jgi:hypothetical protein
MKDKTISRAATVARQRRGDDGLGANSDIGVRLRALYASVQEESIPDRLLDLLEKLDQVEQASKVTTRTGESA